MHKSIHLGIAVPLPTCRHCYLGSEFKLQKRRRKELHLGLKMNFKTVCLLFTYLTSVCSQFLYETNYQQHNVLNERSRDVVFHSLLDETEDLLKVTMSKMQRCVDLDKQRVVANEGLLKMYSTGQFLNGKFLIF